MKNNYKDRIIKNGVDTILTEISSLKSLIPRLKNNFVKLINLILNCKGRVVITGIGKSGAIGRKITATLASTGTPSFFIHSTEGSHGDLGMITSEDIVIILSYSGETDEVSVLLPSLKRIGVKIIAITGNINSTLSKFSDIVLNVKVKKEACPNNLAPTSSTTAMLVLGDAIAVTLIKERNFTSEQFALFHPSGILGKSLIITVNDIMHTKNELPIVNEDDSVKDTIITITSKMLGVTAVVDKNNKLKGIITDGDLRRLLIKHKNFLDKPIKNFMIKNPKIISSDKLAVEALNFMNEKKITSLFIVNKKNIPIGIIHIHDILKIGLN